MSCLPDLITKANKNTLSPTLQSSHTLAQHRRWADAFVVVYDVTNRTSFSHARGLLHALHAPSDTRPHSRSHQPNYVEKYFKRDTYADDASSQTPSHDTGSISRRCSSPSQSFSPSQCSSLSLCSRPHQCSSSSQCSRLSQCSSRSQSSTPSRCSSPHRCSSSCRCSSPLTCSIAPRCSSPSHSDHPGRESPTANLPSSPPCIKQLFIPPFSRGLERDSFAPEPQDNKQYVDQSQSSTCDEDPTDGGSTSQVQFQYQYCHSYKTDPQTCVNVECICDQNDNYKQNCDTTAISCESAHIREKQVHDLNKTQRMETPPCTGAPFTVKALLTDRDVYNPDHPDPCTPSACIRDREQCCPCDSGAPAHLQTQSSLQLLDETRIRSYTPDFVQGVNPDLENSPDDIDHCLSQDQIRCGGNTPPQHCLSSHAPLADSPHCYETGRNACQNTGSLRPPPQISGDSCVSSNCLDSCQLVTSGSEHNSISPALAHDYRIAPEPDDHLYQTVQRLEASAGTPPRTPAFTTLLLANKRDLEHCRYAESDTLSVGIYFIDYLPFLPETPSAGRLVPDNSYALW